MLLQEESVGSVQNMARQLVNAQEIELCQFIDQHFWILISATNHISFQP